MWRTVSLFTSLLYSIKNFSFKKNFWVGVIWWLGHFKKLLLSKFQNSIQSKQNKVIYYSTTQYVMTWYDNSNIDFKWNITKIMALTLIVKISFQVSKSLLFLLFYKIEGISITLNIWRINIFAVLQHSSF